MVCQVNSGRKVCRANGKRTGQSQLPPPSQGSPDLLGSDCIFFVGAIQTDDSTPNGITKELDAAPAVHVMYTEVYAARLGCLGAAADAQHLQESKGGRTQHHRQAAQGCPKIRACRYDAYGIGSLRSLQSLDKLWSLSKTCHNQLEAILMLERILCSP